MKFFIKETGEIRDLSAFDDDGMDYIPELLEEGGLPHTLEGYAEISQKECNWWTTCLKHHEEDAKDILALSRRLGIPVKRIREEIDMEMTGRDIDYEHAVTQAVLADFEAGRLH